MGPLPGHYLGTDHTRLCWRKEQFMPRVADRLTYAHWTEQGKKVALDYARERMHKILAQPDKTYLTPGQEEDVERVLQEAREYYRQRGQV